MARTGMGRDLVDLSVEQSRSTIDGELLSIRVGHPVLDEQIALSTTRSSSARVNQLSWQVKGPGRTTGRPQRSVHSGPAFAVMRT
jgi:hypothetical protein